MSRPRTHVVEDSEDDSLILTALCGRRLMSRSDALLSLAVTPLDDYLEAMQGIVVPKRIGERNWITVDEFIDGDDSPDCIPCRRRLDGHIDRRFEPEDTRASREAAPTDTPGGPSS